MQHKPNLISSTSSSFNSIHTRRHSHQNHPTLRTNNLPQREDAQPNETSSWLPHRLRRPVEPPSIRPAASNSILSKSTTNNLKTTTTTTHHSNQDRHPLPSYPSLQNHNNSSNHPPQRSNEPSHHHRNHSLHRPSSSYRTNYSYTSTRSFPSISDYPRDPYRFRRHSAYERSQADHYAPTTSSNSRSNHRSNLDPDRHSHSRSSNLIPMPESSDSNTDHNLKPVLTNSETSPVLSLNRNPSSALSDHYIHPASTHHSESYQPNYKSQTHSTPYHPFDQPEPSSIHPIPPTSPSSTSNQRMGSTYIKNSSGPDQISVISHINTAPARRSPPTHSSDPESIRDEGPAFKKMKMSEVHSHDHPPSPHPPVGLDEKTIRLSTPQKPLFDSLQEARPTSPQESQFASLKQSRIVLPQQESWSGLAPRPIEPASSTLKFQHTVAIRGLVAPSTTRADVEKLVFNIFNPNWLISKFKLNDFRQAKKCTSIGLSVTFQDSRHALMARRARSLAIPSQFSHKQTRLTVLPKLSDEERALLVDLHLPACLRLPPPNQILKTSPPSQEVNYRDERDAQIRPDHSAPESPREGDIEIQSNVDEETRDNGHLLHSRCSSRSKMRSPSSDLLDSSSNKPLKPSDKPDDPSRAPHATLDKTSLNPSQPHQLETCDRRQNSDLAQTVCLSTQAPPTRGRRKNLDIAQSAHSSAPPTLVHRSILAHSHIRKFVTLLGVHQLIKEILGREGSIETIKMNQFSQGKKATYFISTVIFQEAHSARKALSKMRYTIPSPYTHDRNRLIILPTRPTVELVSLEQEAATPVDPYSHSSCHTDSSSVSQNPTDKHMQKSDEKPSVEVISQHNPEHPRLRPSKTRMRPDSHRAQSIESCHSSLVRHNAESVESANACLSKSIGRQSVAEDYLSSEDMPLWDGKNGPKPTDVKRRGPPASGFDCPDSLEDPGRDVDVNVLDSGNRDGEPIQSTSSNHDTSRTSRVAHKQLWVKGHFHIGIQNEQVESFVRSLLEPSEEIIDLKIHGSKAGLFDLIVTVKHAIAAERALKLLHGAVLPARLAFRHKNYHYLHVSFDYYPDSSCLASKQFKKSKSIPPFRPFTDDSPLEQDATSPSSNPPSPDSRSAHSRCSSPELTHVKEHSSETPDVMHVRTQTHSSDLHSTLTSNNQPGHDPQSKPLEPVPTQLELPLRVVKYPIPPTCQESHPSYIANRLRFKLEKIRLLSSLEETVLDSSWESLHLILHVVTKPEGSLPLQVESPTESNPTKKPISNPSTTSQLTAPINLVGQQSSHSNQSCLETSPIRTLDEPSVYITSTNKHRTWPFDPLPIHLDDSIFPDFSNTLMDFLTTFFRLWEESRSDLQSLYDESAVFSNILAKQGRKPLAITKSTGWPKIFQSMSRLPALSNEPISSLVVDACPCVINPPRVVCSIHGAFSEFPKNIKRAFDRTLILRPTDTHLRPAEGCLGLLKWIILSDTLTIRKHSSRTEAIVEGFEEKRNTFTYAPSGQDGDLAQRTFQDKLRTPQLPGPETDILAPSSSSRPFTRSTHSPIRISSPIQKVHASEFSTGEHVNQSMNPYGFDPRTQSEVPSEEIGVTSENADQSAGDLAQIQSQLRAMQAEIQHLRSLTQNPTLSNSTIQDEHRMSCHNHPPQPSDSSPQNHNLKVISSTSCSHVGFGVSSKRLLLSTNLSRYLVISMRGDILTWDPTHSDSSSQVKLSLSGASPTDIVDSACYSNPSQTLVVGSRISKNAKNVHGCSIRLIRFHQSSSRGTLNSQRIEIEDPYHENGVRALTLSPNTMNETNPNTSFLTAGNEKFISLWKITHQSFKKLKHYQKDIVQIHTDHTSVIQALAFDHSRRWVLSGGQDGKVYATDLARSNYQTLFSEEKNHIFDIQMNPLVQDTVMITTGNKAPGSQFRYCDLRMTKPVISFGLGASTYGNIELPVKYHRKGSIRDYLFSYPNGEKGGVLVWDLRYPTVPSSTLNTSNGIGIQTYFESMNSIVVLEKENLTRSELKF